MKNLISFTEEKNVHPKAIREPERGRRVPEHLLQGQQPSLSEDAAEERGKRGRVTERHR